MFREFLNDIYFQEAEYVNYLYEDLIRCEKALEQIKDFDCIRQSTDIEDALWRYHLDLQMDLNDYMDRHFRTADDFICRKGNNFSERTFAKQRSVHDDIE